MAAKKRQTLQEAASSKKRARVQHSFSSNFTSKILKEALRQQKEIADEEASAVAVESAISAAAVEAEGVDDDIYRFDELSEVTSEYDLAREQEEINEEDEQVLQAFMSGPLADIIIQKIKEKNADVSNMPKPDSQIIDIYKGVGKILSRYSSGKLPKAFKHIPSMELWEDVLYLTEPQQWSSNAVYQATRIFSSNLGVKKAQQFYNLVLLPCVRDNILKNKTLHFDLYQAMKKSLYKPAAFFEGFLFPLCQSGTCSLKEAKIVGSVIQKVSIPSIHSSAALVVLAKMVYSCTTSYFIKILLDKKYALSYGALDTVVAYFMRFLEEPRLMPVFWHKSLLSFVQRYKNELTKDDKNDLVKLIQYQKHHLVTSEIHRELKDSCNRGEKEKEDDAVSISSSLSVINKNIEEDRGDFPEVPMEEE